MSANSAWTNQYPQNITITSRAIGSITATVTLEEVGNDELEITEHPVQQGANIADHAYVKPSTLNLKIGFDSSTQPLNEIYANLLALQDSREPFTVTTTKRVYNNMLFKTLSQNTDPTTQYILSVSAVFQQIIIVNISTASIPPTSNQKSPQITQDTTKAGQKNALPVDPDSAEGQNVSIAAQASQALFGGG